MSVLISYSTNEALISWFWLKGYLWNKWHWSWKLSYIIKHVLIKYLPSNVKFCKFLWQFSGGHLGLGAKYHFSVFVSTWTSIKHLLVGIIHLGYWYLSETRWDQHGTQTDWHTHKNRRWNFFYILFLHSLMIQMNHNKLCWFVDIMIYCIVLLFFVNMADEYSRLIGVALHNLCVYIVTNLLVFIGEFKMRHNSILLIEIQGNHVIFLLSTIML